MLDRMTPLTAEAPRGPLPAVVHVAASVLALRALQLTAATIGQLLQPPTEHAASLDAMSFAPRLAFIAVDAVLAAGLWRRRSGAWRWAVGVAMLRLTCYAVYPLAIVHYAPADWHPEQYYGWSGLSLQITPLLTLVLLLLPASRRAFARRIEPAVSG